MSASGKLDQSLDQIMKDRKPTSGPRRGKARLPARKAGTKAKAATAAVIAPTGGVQKNARAPRVKTTLMATTQSGDSKISVSNLPEDVTERMIKDYFGSSVAPVKHVTLNYGPTGRSRGSAVVLFSKPTAASEAAKHDGIKVDGKAMRIEVLLGAKNVPEIPAPKPLSERVSKPKNAAHEKAKTAAAKAKDVNNNSNNNNKTTTSGKAGRNKKSGRAGRPKAKTTEELDAEMQDYFGGGDTNSAAQPAAATNGGDTGMVDEVL